MRHLSPTPDKGEFVISVIWGHSKRKPHIQHNCKMDDLRAGFEIAEGNMFRHSLITNYRGSHQQEDLF